MNLYWKNVLSALGISGVVVLLVAACGGGGDGGSAPNVAGDYVFSVSSFTVECTDGSRFVADGSSEVVRVTQSGNAITVQSLTFSADALANLLGVDILAASQSGRVRSDSTFSLEESATLRDRFDGDIYDVRVNLDGTFSDDGWSGQGRYSIGSRLLNVTCKALTPFSGAKIAAGAELRSEPSLTGAVPFDVYDSPGVVFRMLGIQ
jgi:hypothetical protein